MALPTVWQIGTGDAARPYAQWLFEHQVAAVGPGSGGAWPRTDYEYAPGVRGFAGEAKPGDLVIARHGVRLALGVGVLGKYAFSEDLDDVEGWDLCHYRRTRWVATEPHRFARRVLAMDRFIGCADPEVLAWVAEQVDGRDLSLQPQTGLPDLPDLGPRLDVDALPAPLADVVRRAERWARYTWEGAFAAEPAEAELLCHLTVPLLVALDWPPEQIALHWARTGIALFGELRRAPEACRLLIEGKRLGDGLGFARDQVDGYARERVGRPVDVAVTDGPRVRLYRHDQPDEPLYANLYSPRATAAALFGGLRYRPDA
ncbi:MAG: hypothetical protein ACRDPC_12845 [Solirubrobacteraceae bacterium]